MKINDSPSPPPPAGKSYSNTTIAGINIMFLNFKYTLHVIMVMRIRMFTVKWFMCTCMFTYTHECGACVTCNFSRVGRYSQCLTWLRKGRVFILDSVGYYLMRKIDSEQNFCANEKYVSHFWNRFKCNSPPNTFHSTLFNRWIHLLTTKVKNVNFKN